MQWVADHWFELATLALLAVIAINTLDSRWNNATLVEQLNDIIRRFSWLARRNAESRRNDVAVRIALITTHRNQQHFLRLVRKAVQFGARGRSLG
jgi:hypothetical protein